MNSQLKHRDEFNETFIPTREAGLKRLKEFAPLAGEIYSNKRNFDFSSIEKNSVSALSPWIKHRLITEEEVIVETPQVHHNPQTAMKFIQEVFWRGYFKGWLEHHPTVWSHHNKKLINEYNNLDNNKFVKKNYMSAINGETGIECFDFWCEQLKSTGYLHNHVRMWFASIWVFTLKLPMELGADFFMLTLNRCRCCIKHPKLEVGKWPTHKRQSICSKGIQHRKIYEMGNSIQQDS